MGHTPIAWLKFTKRRERDILDALLERLYERNPEQFTDKQAVFEVFAQGMMTGNLLPIGRLVDSTFGRGTLRRIGELDDDLDAQEEFVKSL